MIIFKFKQAKLEEHTRDFSWVRYWVPNQNLLSEGTKYQIKKLVYNFFGFKNTLSKNKLWIEKKIDQ